MDWGRLFFSAYGRIRRQEFWISFLVLLGVSLLLGWLFPICLVVLYCSICTRAKRLHDMGRSGWFQVIPVVGFTVATIMSIYFAFAAIIAGASFSTFNEALAATSVVFGIFTVIATWVVAFLVDLGFLLWIGVSEGEVGDNRFGPEPLTINDPYAVRA